MIAAICELQRPVAYSLNLLFSSAMIQKISPQQRHAVRSGVSERFEPLRKWFLYWDALQRAAGRHCEKTRPFFL